MKMKKSKRTREKKIKKKDYLKKHVDIEVTSVYSTDTVVTSVNDKLLPMGKVYSTYDIKLWRCTKKLKLNLIEPKLYDWKSKTTVIMKVK